MRRVIRAPVGAFLGTLLSLTAIGAAADVPSVFSEEAARFRGLAKSTSDELRIEAAQGFFYLKHAAGEVPLLSLVDAESALVRLEATKALGVCGGRRSVPILIERLRDPEWEIRRAAHDALGRMTGQTFSADRYGAWRAWLEDLFPPIDALVPQ